MHLRRLVSVLAVCLGISAPVLATSNIVISQVYGGGGNTGGTLKNDFIEVFNRGTTTVNLTGRSVQYASSSGTTWQATNLSGSIAPGKYYLVQEAAGTGGTVNLPTPDATGSIAMSATGAKVALVNSTTLLSGNCRAAADFFGYDGATCFEDAATAPLTNTTAALRNGAGCTDTDNNAADFTIGAPAPRNSATAANLCTVTNNPPAINAPANPAATVLQNAARFSKPHRVVDTTAPAITGWLLSTTSLWPPNHQMVDVSVTYTSTDLSNTACALTVSSNEPINGLGDGDTAPDWEIVDAHHVRLRAERGNKGNGRVYTIMLRCTDGFGNIGSSFGTVTVPKSNSGGS